MSARPLELSPRRAAVWLAILTLIAAGLRFYDLGFPSARTDEAFTYWRTCGSLKQTFDTLRLDAFVPLHYELVWGLTRLLGHELWVLRTPSAVFGTLMPLALYQLARVVFGRRVGIVAAMLGVASAYLCFYARDAKMYVPAWCMTTFAMAAALGYARTGRRKSWLLWVFYGTAAAGLHAVTLIPLVLTPIAALGADGRRKVARFVIALIGLGAITIGPAMYYVTFNRWFQVSGGLSGVPSAGIEEPAHDNGLMWVNRWQSEYDASGVLRQCLSAYLAGYEYPPEPPGQLKSDEWGDYEAWQFFRAALLGFAGIGAVAMLARVFSPAHHRQAGSLWIGVVLIAIPLYAFYLRSFADLKAPWQIAPWPVLVAGIVVVFQVMRQNRRGAVAWIVLSILALTAMWSVARYAHSQVSVWNHLWMPRYSAIIVAPLLVGVAVLLCSVPTRVLRCLAIGAVVGVNGLVSVVWMTHPTGWPDDRLGMDVAQTMGNNKSVVICNFATPDRKRLFNPIVSRLYHLATAAQLDLTPAQFRNGNEWPYAPGPGMIDYFQKVRVVAGSPSARALRIPDEVDRLIVWTVDTPLTGQPWEHPDWKMVRHEQFTIRAAWQWRVMWHLGRTEYERSTAATQPRTRSTTGPNTPASN